MPDNIQNKSLLEKKNADAAYRKRHDDSYAAFKLEAQILMAMEKKNWSYTDLANATHTSKGNISRDLKAGGILRASLSRINKIADALGMKLVALLIPKEHEPFLMPKFEILIRNIQTSVEAEARIEQPRAVANFINVMAAAKEQSPNYSFTCDAEVAAVYGVK